MRAYIAVAFLLCSIPGYAASLYFPQIANGGGYQTTIIISNTGQDAVTGTLKFYTPQGQTWSLAVNSTTNWQFAFSIPGAGSKRFVTSGTGSIAVGWALIDSTGSVSGVASFTMRSGSKLTESIGVLGTVTMKRFKTPADLSSTADLGTAIVNTGDSPLKVKLTLADEQGNVTHTSNDPAYLSIPGHAYVSKYVSSAFTGLPSTYKGNLIAEVDGDGAIAAIGITLEEGVQSVVPVTDHSPSMLKPIVGWFDFYYDFYGEPYEDYYYLGWMQPPEGYSGDPGMIWGTDDYPDPAYGYWDDSEDSWVVVHPVPWFDYNDVYVFKFTSDDSISGCYYFQDPMDGPRGDCHPLDGDYWVD